MNRRGCCFIVFVFKEMRDTSVCLFRVRIEPVDWTKWLRQKKVEVIQGLKSLRDQININYEGMEHEMNGNT